jgi:outer membrane protein OmpA-like peptidoglycan-associated protein
MTSPVGYGVGPTGHNKVLISGKFLERRRVGMACRQVVRYLSYLGVIALAGVFIAGCVIQDPPALGEIAKARKALDGAKKDGMMDREPDKILGLEKRYLQARGVFYACNDAEAARLAQSIVADLAMKPAPAPAPENQAPVARLSVPASARVGEAVPMDASASSDPDGDPLSYTFDFGDGSAPAKFTFPRTTHSYAKAGNYTVEVTVDDGRGHRDSATARTKISLRFVMSDKKGRVLFDFDKADLKPAARQELQGVLQALKENPSLQTNIVGHTDSKGSDAYNMKLSQRRSNAVASYLAASGVARQTITTEARGEREPIATNATATGRAQNRRVEITLTPR